ncbi:pyridoxal phosphate-dependent aminotransferase [Cohaesibacter gelatinilyticus]|uniref:aspartate transaminase n=1 Tax=Cohaesibacter gelatinilyticus TaxID=372072 RepID=A0A285NFF5_9HYPH|nr:aminotransferase class I/II-fold pyridoxal phosphate-dependent enzyme [Cohaesibacter gelatinilyticus]SNZ08008.1 Aspartate/methionine/tyrosine aminotransferase [Cohaesibacter gelatinilyticus]HAT85906.1 1-aminocyclopropane-1-carboxylate deaminase [Hyphomicrobiales bacterium]
MLTTSNRGAIQPFLAMDVMSAANRLEAAGQDVVHMEVGQPGAPAPQIVRDAAARALQDGRIGYTDALGIRSLRERIAAYYSSHHGLEVNPDRIAVTTGSSAGFNLAFLALFEVGDRVILPTPGYPAYRNILGALGLGVVEVETKEEDRWCLTPEAIRAEHARNPIKGVLIASPANPSGTIMEADALKAVIETCEELGIWFISDEIYHGLEYDMKAECALHYSPNVVIINSFSKYYCMTGWRIGWMVLPDAALRSVECLGQSLYISAPMLSQVAAIAAFDATDELDIIKAGYARNRDLLMAELPKIGLGNFMPMDGAFYVYCDIGNLTNDSMDFAKRSLEEAKVAITPGADFDVDRGHRYVRLSFAGTYCAMEEAVRRLGGWLA